MNNLKIRIAMVEFGLKQWQVAEIIGINESCFSIKLRNELPDEEQERIVRLIEESKKKGE